MDISIGGMIGLYGGMICGLLGWWFGRRAAKKNRGLDELYYHIWQKARSISWYVTLVAIYIFFSLIVFGIDLSPAMVLGLLLLTHLGSWGITGAILSFNMTSPEPFQISRVVTGVMIVTISMIVFTILSIITKNWLFLILSIPPNIIGLYTALVPDKKNAN